MHGNGAKLHLDAHFYRLSASSHCIVLKTNQYSKELLKFVPLSKVKSLHEKLIEDVSGDVQISVTLLSQMKNLIEENIGTQKSELKEKLSEFQKENHSSMNKNEKLVFECLSTLAINLPASEYVLPINENDLKTNYITIFLQPFVDKDMNLLKWSEVNHQDRVHRTSRRKAADCIVYQLDQGLLGKGVAFGEVKSINHVNKTRNLTLDLYRLVHFAKDSIDGSNLEYVLLFQSIGPKITFYMATLVTEATYCIFEIFSLNIPLHYSSITDFKLKDFKNLCMLEHLFDKCKQKSVPIHWKRSSLVTPQLNGLVTNTQSKSDAVIRF